MGRQVPNSNEVVELPRSLQLPFLHGLTAKELLLKCEWFILIGRTSFETDRELGLLGYYDGEGHPHEALCCVVPKAGEPRSEDAGIPWGLAKWLLRKEIAEAALPQPALPLALRQQAKKLGLSFGEVRS